MKEFNDLCSRNSGIAMIGIQRILGCLMKHNSHLLYISSMTMTFFRVKKNLFLLKKKKSYIYRNKIYQLFMPNIIILMKLIYLGNIIPLNQLL